MPQRRRCAPRDDASWPHHYLRRQSGDFDSLAAHSVAFNRRRTRDGHLANRPPLDGRAFPPRPARRLLPRRGRIGQRRCQPLRAGLRPPRARTAARPAVLPVIPRRLEPRGACGRRVQLPVRVGVDVAGLLGIGDVAPSRKRQRTRRLCVYRNGKLFRPRPAPVLRIAGRHDRQLCVLNHTRQPPIIRHRRPGTPPGPDRCWFESRRRATARLAAARSSRRTEPCLGPHERCDDQGRRLRFHTHRLRSGRCANLVVGCHRYSLSAASQQC